MTTRADQLATAVDHLATRRRGFFIFLLVLCLLGVAVGTILTIAILAVGPIGIELQKPFLNTLLSRLAALQLSAFLSLAFMGAFIALSINWRSAPRGLRTFCCVGAWHRLAQSFKHRSSLQNLRGKVWLFWLVVGFAILWANMAILIDLPVIACIEPDTIGYLRPSALRSAGYMLFIKAVVGVTGDLKWVVPIQLNLMLCSFAALGWEARNILRSQTMGLVVAILPILSAGLLILAPTVMTEALFVALICCHLAAVLSVLRQYHPFMMLLAGLTLGLLIVVRPNGISFLVGIPLLVFFFKDRWRIVMLAMAAPVTAIVLAQCAYHFHTFGFFGLHRFGGIALAANAAPLITANMPSTYPDLAKELEQRFRTYYVDFPTFAKRSYPFEMARVASLTAVGAIYSQILPAIRAKLGLPDPETVAFEYDPRIDSIAGSLAVSAIRNDPWGFAKIVSSNYIANWHATLAHSRADGHFLSTLSGAFAGCCGAARAVVVPGDQSGALSRCRIGRRNGQDRRRRHPLYRMGPGWFSASFSCRWRTWPYWHRWPGLSRSCASVARRTKGTVPWPTPP